MIERWLLLWLTLLAGVAYFWSDWFPSAADPFLLTREWHLLSPMFAVAMLAIGSLLPAADVNAVGRRWPTVLGGTLVQYGSMPMLAVGVGRLFGLEGDMLAGVIVVGCVPGAMASNVLTQASRGNTSYSVSLTTSATLLSPFVVPVVLWLALDADVQLNPISTSFQLLWTVVLPVVFGHLLSRFVPAAEQWAQRYGAAVANLVILWIIAVVVALNRSKLADVTPLVLAALLLLNLLGYVAGFLGGRVLRLSDSMGRALVLEVGMQNAGMGTLIVLEQLKGHPGAAVATAAYTFGCMLTGSVLAGFWASRPPRDYTPFGSPAGDGDPECAGEGEAEANEERADQ